MAVSGGILKKKNPTETNRTDNNKVEIPLSKNDYFPHGTEKGFAQMVN